MLDLAKVLFNLLSNAAKFTRDGAIRLEVERLRRSGDAWLLFRVSDTGIGMTHEQAERVFEPFSQADASTTRRFGGTGLGLPLSRQFCGLLGGTLDVSSEPGHGSCFTVSLPAGVVHAPNDPDPPA